MVHAEAAIESKGDTCTTDCGKVYTTCTLPEIEDPSAVVTSCGGVETALDAECQAP